MKKLLGKGCNCLACYGIRFDPLSSPRDCRLIELADLDSDALKSRLLRSWKEEWRSAGFRGRSETNSNEPLGVSRWREPRQ